MKKIFLFVAMVATVALLNVSCKKDDKKDPQEVANNLIGEWQGYISGYKKNNSQWDFNNERGYAVIRFLSAGNNNKSGMGNQLEFKNEHMTEKTDYAEFSWKIEDDKIRISYLMDGWGDVYIYFNDVELNSSVFKGEMFDYTDHKYVFDLTKKTFSRWNEFIQ